MKSSQCAIYLSICLGLAGDIVDVAANQGNPCIIRGPEFMYEVSAPSNWVIAVCISERRQESEVMAVPEGSDSIDSGPTTMAVDHGDRSGPSGKQVSADMANDRTFYATKGATFLEGDSLMTADRHTARVLKIMGGSAWPYWHANAYVAGGPVSVRLSLRAHDFGLFTAAYPAFEEFVRTFQFVPTQSSKHD